MDHDRSNGTGLDIPTEVLVAVCVELATTVLFTWARATGEFSLWIIYSGTFIAVLVILSPICRLWPPGLRGYQSRFATASTVQTGEINLKGSGSIATEGGIAAGQGGTAVAGDVQGNVNVYNIESVGALAEWLGALLLWLLGVLSLLIMAIPLLAFLLIFADLLVIIVPILLSVALLFIPL